MRNIIIVIAENAIELLEKTHGALYYRSNFWAEVVDKDHVDVVKSSHSEEPRGPVTLTTALHHAGKCAIAPDPETLKFNNSGIQYVYNQVLRGPGASGSRLHGMQLFVLGGDITSTTTTESREGYQDAADDGACNDVRQLALLFKAQKGNT